MKKSPFPVLARQLCDFVSRPGALACALGLSLVSNAFAQSKSGEPPASGVDPGRQGERDWVDGRWNKTDVGQFLASNLSIPRTATPRSVSEKIEDLFWSKQYGLWEVPASKPLSIKVGDHDEGAVCFDTRDCVLRAGWTGGFLGFDPGRFGLIGAPKIAGKLAFVTPPGPGWQNSYVRYRGLHLHGKRVVLEYLINGVRVLESPWFETTKNGPVFTRSFEFAPSDDDLKFVVLDGAGTVGGGIEWDRDNPRVAAAEKDSKQPHYGRARGIAVDGATTTEVFSEGNQNYFARQGGRVTVGIPPSPAVRRLKITFWRGASDSAPGFEGIPDNVSAPEDLAPLLTPGPARWLPELTTTGSRGMDNDILAVDTLTVPYDNPWKALMFAAGVDFTADGAAYVCTIHGDVWRVTGIDGDLRQIHWKRYATGLFQPLGLKVRDGKVYVLGRDQITCLHDLNNDGEADFYENFCNLIYTNPGGHEYVTSLEKDDAGNFYFCDPKGAHRVSPDGRSMNTLATGFRNPNGLGVNPEGTIVTVTPQQGNWTPSSVIVEVKSGGYYGYGGPKITARRPLGYDSPLCWIPHSIDNSSASQVWVPEKLWGPLGGKIVHLRWGGCGLMLLLRDTVAGIPQGAIVELPGRFLSGPHRGSFSPADGALYIAGSAGWQTSAIKDGCLQRVRFTGKPVFLPVAWHAQDNGVALEFSQKLDPSTANDAGSYSLHQWNYKYAAAYGSEDWSVANPGKKGHDDVNVKSARLLPDGKTVFLETDNLSPVMQMQIDFNLSSTTGLNSRSRLWLTLNALDTGRHY